MDDSSRGDLGRLLSSSTMPHNHRLGWLIRATSRFGNRWTSLAPKQYRLHRRRPGEPGSGEGLAYPAANAVISPALQLVAGSTLRSAVTPTAMRIRDGANNRFPVYSFVRMHVFLPAAIAMPKRMPAPGPTPLPPTWFAGADRSSSSVKSGANVRSVKHFGLGDFRLSWLQARQTGHMPSVVGPAAWTGADPAPRAQRLTVRKQPPVFTVAAMTEAIAPIGELRTKREARGAGSVDGQFMPRSAGRTFAGQAGSGSAAWDPVSGAMPISPPDGIPDLASSRDDTPARAKAKPLRLHIDGHALGQWAIEHLTQTLGGPPSGITGIDPRAAPPRSRVSPF